VVACAVKGFDTGLFPPTASVTVVHDHVRPGPAPSIDSQNVDWIRSSRLVTIRSALGRLVGRTSLRSLRAGASRWPLPESTASPSCCHQARRKGVIEFRSLRSHGFDGSHEGAWLLLAGCGSSRSGVLR
jgi:hypothetical protein